MSSDYQSSDVGLRLPFAAMAPMRADVGLTAQKLLREFQLWTVLGLKRSKDAL